MVLDVLVVAESMLDRAPSQNRDHVSLYPPRIWSECGIYSAYWQMALYYLSLGPHYINKYECQACCTESLYSLPVKPKIRAGLGLLFHYVGFRFSSFIEATPFAFICSTKDKERRKESNQREILSSITSQVVDRSRLRLPRGWSWLLLGPRFSYIELYCS